MAKTVKLGESNPIITNVRVLEFDGNGNLNEIFNEKNQYGNLVVEMNKKQLAESMVDAHLDNQHDFNFAQFLKEVITNEQMDEAVFEIARVAVEHAVKFMGNGPEKMVVKAALAYLKQIENGEF